MTARLGGMADRALRRLGVRTPDPAAIAQIAGTVAELEITAERLEAEARRLRAIAREGAALVRTGGR